MKKFLLSVAAVAMTLSANAAEVKLVGGFNGWSAETALAFEEKDGAYVLEVESLLPDFKILEDGAYLGSETPLTLGEALTLGDTGMGGNIVFADAELKAVANATLVYKLEDKTLTVTGEQGEVSITYAVHGNFFAADWTSVDMKLVEGAWVVAFEALENASGEFGIKELTDGAQTAWYSAPKTADYITITGAASDLLCATSDNTNFKVDGLSGTWTFKFDAENLTLSVVEGDQTGIAAVEAADNAAAVYYNLNGVRVANPQNGLFIKKQGNVVTKVIVK